MCIICCLLTAAAYITSCRAHTKPSAISQLCNKSPSQERSDFSCLLSLPSRWNWLVTRWAQVVERWAAEVNCMPLNLRKDKQVLTPTPSEALGVRLTYLVLSSLSLTDPQAPRWPRNHDPALKDTLSGSQSNRRRLHCHVAWSCQSAFGLEGQHWEILQLKWRLKRNGTW